MSEDGVFRILSIDGGGIFGYIPATFLAHSAGRRTLTGIDMYAGTSIGGIISAALAIGYSPEYIADMFPDFAEDVFTTNRWRQIKSVFSGSRYSPDPLQEYLSHLFAFAALNDLSPYITIPVKNMRDDTLEVWDNIPGSESEFGEQPIVNACRCTSAAPTYFPPHDGRVDGGWLCNNPSLIALTKAIDNDLADWSEIRILSLGTGQNTPDKDRPPVEQWGMVDFIKPLITNVTKSSEQTTDYYMTMLAGSLDNYERFNPVKLPSHWSMDDPSLLKQENGLESIPSSIHYSFIDEFITVFDEFMEEKL